MLEYTYNTRDVNVLISIVHIFLTVHPLFAQIAHAHWTSCSTGPGQLKSKRKRQNNVAKRLCDAVKRFQQLKYSHNI